MPVELGFGGVDTELGGVGDGAEDLGDVKPLFGGDATTDQTGATGTLFVDQDHIQPEVVGIKGGGVTTWTATYYDDVCQI
jgi:hypothetical protein